MSQTKKTRKTSNKTRTSSPSRKKAGDSRATKSGSTKAGRSGRMDVPEAIRSAGDREVTIDRRRPQRAATGEGGTASLPSAGGPKLERRKKVNRRRQIDPTTCERDYTGDEIEFMNALDEYKRKSGRMFPTCSEVLEVVRSLGYSKQSIGQGEPQTAPDSFAGPKSEGWFASPAQLTEALPL